MKRGLILSAMLLLPGIACAQSSSLNAPALVSATTSASSSVVVSGQHTLLGFHVTAPSAGYVLAFDATSEPANGAVQPLGCFTMPAPVAPGISATLSMANVPVAAQTQTGITVVFSTTGCFTKTASATAFISVLYQ